LLLLATLLSTLAIGAHLQHDFDRNVWPFSDDNDHFLFWGWALSDWHRLILGWRFAACLLGILTAHELGHYILCRRRGVQASLPYFIPFPSQIGTLGAVIRIQSPIRSRKDLFDIGIAGPIAGFAVALPILFFSLVHSKPFGDIQVADSFPVLGMPLIFNFARWALHAMGIHGAAADLHTQLYLAPTALAAWFGMLATALNLIPGGQLDGGHIVYALDPRAHRWVSTLCILGLVVLGWYFWAGWLLWAVLLRVTASRRPVVPQQPGLDRKSKRLALAAALMLVVTWIPSPLPGNSLAQMTQGIRQTIRDWRHH
jgi:membrane-associated protease RseP (regulator of RpoE activity)